MCIAKCVPGQYMWVHASQEEEEAHSADYTLFNTYQTAPTLTYLPYSYSNVLEC